MIKRTFLAYCLAVVSALASQIEISDIRCEYRRNPVGIETLQPRLSWVLESKARAVIQQAYQVQVADSLQSLEKDQGNLWDSGQTFYALAFGLGLVPEEIKDKVASQFVSELHAQDDHIATGFLGTPFILFALQKAGHPELAYELVLNRTYPSWLQQVLWGSTTMWERWDGWRPDKGFQDPGMNSFNHYWLGCVSEWLFTQAAGIDTDGPSFKRIVIRPQIITQKNGFQWVKASYRSIHGLINSQWKLKGDRFYLNVTVPANCVAAVYIPANKPSDVTEGGRPAEHVDGLEFLRIEKGNAVFRIGSGEYAFSTHFAN